MGSLANFPGVQPPLGQDVCVQGLGSVGLRLTTGQVPSHSGRRHSSPVFETAAVSRAPLALCSSRRRLGAAALRERPARQDVGRDGTNPLGAFSSYSRAQALLQFLRPTPPIPAFLPALESLRIVEVGFPEPASHSCLAPVAQGSAGTVEMSPARININKKQMNLLGGLLSINQAARPLMANTVQVGRGETFSWPPPGLNPTPLRLLLGPFLSRSGTNSRLEGGAGRVQETRRAPWRRLEISLPPGTKGSQWPSTHPSPNPGPSGLASQVSSAAPLVDASCSLFLHWQLP